MANPILDEPGAGLNAFETHRFVDRGVDRAGGLCSPAVDVTGGVHGREYVLEAELRSPARIAILLLSRSSNCHIFRTKSPTIHVVSLTVAERALSRLSLGGRCVEKSCTDDSVR